MSPEPPLSERLRRARDWALQRVAHRLPRSLAYWSFIDTGARHIRPYEIVPSVTYMGVLQRLGEDV